MLPAPFYVGQAPFKGGLFAYGGKALVLWPRIEMNKHWEGHGRRKSGSRVA